MVTLPQSTPTPSNRSLDLIYDLVSSNRSLKKSLVWEFGNFSDRLLEPIFTTAGRCFQCTLAVGTSHERSELYKEKEAEKLEDEVKRLEKQYESREN